MKKLLLISAMFILLLGRPIYALTIDLQPYTQCGLTSCTVTVDMGKVKSVDDKALAVADITSLKSVALETKAVALPKEVSNLKSDWKNDILTFTANIKAGSSNYFTINYNGIVLDPWFNSTVWSNWTNPDTTANPAPDPDNHQFGYIIKMTNVPNGAFNLYVRKSSQANGVNCGLYNYGSTSSVGALIQNASLVGNLCNFTNVNMLNNTNYTLVIDSTTRTYGAQHYPYVNSFFSVLTRIYKVGGVWSSSADNTFTIEEINISYANNTYVAEPTSVTLFLNGNTTNITLPYGTALNSTAVLNKTTTSYFKIIINNTVANTSNSSVVYNISNLTVGLWNISGIFDSGIDTGSYKTLWANITNTTTPAAPSSSHIVGYTYCTANTTLGHINVTNLQTDNVITYYENCPYGCDNVTKICSPPLYQTNLLVLAIVIIMLFAMYRIYKWL